MEPDGTSITVARLVDEGQNYITFLIEAGLIVWSSPNLKEGWRGTRILNEPLSPGGNLRVMFHNGYDMPLPHLVAQVAEGTLERI